MKKVKRILAALSAAVLVGSMGMASASAEEALPSLSFAASTKK